MVVRLSFPEAIAWGACRRVRARCWAIESVLPRDGYSRLDLRMSKGSTVFFHGELVHFSNDNRSDRFRHAFLGTYIRAGSPFRAGTYQKRTEVDLRAR
jgi:ectoine hydroxylase-related dioxygenase (phytanoyl-CoA dioxygenase family)